MTGSRRVLRVGGLVMAMSLTAAVSGDDTPRCLPAPADPREVVLTDEQAKEMILRNFGPDVANSLRHRLTKRCLGLAPWGGGYSSPR
jgi:hypothetical protein